MRTIETKDGTIRPMWLEEMAEQLKGRYKIGRKKAREKEWERIKNERFNLDAEYELN